MAAKGFGRLLGTLREVTHYLWKNGWSERNAGNISADVTGTAPRGRVRGPWRHPADRYPELGGRSFLITGTGKRFRDFAATPELNACIITMSPAGDAWRLTWGGGGNAGFMPTSELSSHLGVHRTLARSRRGERVIIHTHPTELIALTHFPRYSSPAALNRALWAVHPEVKITLPRGVGVVPYLVPSSRELGAATAAAFGRGVNVAVWVKHGVVATGRDGMDAFDDIETINKAARMILLCLAAGRPPSGLSSRDIRDLIRAFRLPC